MTGLNKELLHNANFSEWDSATVVSTWESTSTTATTLSRIRETDTVENGRYGTFNFKPYIYDGGSALRATLTSAAAAGNFIHRQPDASAAGVVVEPGDVLTAKVAGRCSVSGNLARIQIIGLNGTTDTYYLEPVGNTATNAAYVSGPQRFTWNTSARNIDVVFKNDVWLTYGFNFIVPMGMTSVAIRFGNGSAGAQVLDFGYVGIAEIDRRRVA